MQCQISRLDHLYLQVPDLREQVVSPTSAYQMVRMLEGVVKRGTGRRIAKIGKPLAGKTGTTNSNFDTWFLGLPQT